MLFIVIVIVLLFNLVRIEFVLDVCKMIGLLIVGGIILCNMLWVYIKILVYLKSGVILILICLSLVVGFWKYLWLKVSMIVFLVLGLKIFVSLDCIF